MEACFRETFSWTGRETQNWMMLRWGCHNALAMLKYQCVTKKNQPYHTKPTNQPAKQTKTHTKKKQQAKLQKTTQTHEPEHANKHI